MFPVCNSQKEQKDFEAIFQTNFLDARAGTFFTGFLGELTPQFPFKIFRTLVLGAEFVVPFSSRSQVVM